MPSVAQAEAANIASDSSRARVTKDTTDGVAEGRKEFERCYSAEQHNRLTFISDIRFSKLSEQWDERIWNQRQQERRPALTINRTQTFIRQVVNDSRQNKPSIKVRPVDNKADSATANVIAGLIRNIEYASNADIAYDTAIENAVAGGFGYIRVDYDYAFDDAFDMDITIERIMNPLAVYGDPNSTAADGSDWNVAFITDRMSREEFEKKYEGKADVDFEGDAWSEVKVNDTWLQDDGVMLAEWWTREEVEREIVQTTDGNVYSMEQLTTDPDLMLAMENGTIQIKQRRMTKSHKVRQRIMSGVDILEDNEYPGRYIPIIPVYGDEFSVKGRRYFRSLIHQAKDAQRMENYWKTTATELVALAPRVPWIGPKGAFNSDLEKWQTANVKSHPFLEYDVKNVGGQPPQRQPLDSGVAAGAMQQALSASDDMKAIIGMYDASLGVRSNETSGKAIMARQREGDVSTFHFIDNLSRAIRQTGRIMVDLIPHVYTGERVVRTLAEDGSEDAVPINQPKQAVDDDGKPLTERVQVGHDQFGEPQYADQPILDMHDLTVGKYDVTVEAGPSFTTRRQEAAEAMVELARAFPAAVPVIGDLMAKNFDWPGADEFAKRLEKVNPLNQEDQIPPEVRQQIEMGMQEIQRLRAENEQLKSKAQIEGFKAKTDRFKAETDAATDRFNAQTDRMEAVHTIGRDFAQMADPLANAPRVANGP